MSQINEKLIAELIERKRNALDEEQRQNEKQRRKALFKLGILTAFSAIVLVFVTMHMTIKQMTAKTA